MPFLHAEPEVPPQKDPTLCPVWDIRTHRLTGQRFLYRCSFKRGHEGACSIARCC